MKRERFQGTFDDVRRAELLRTTFDQRNYAEALNLVGPIVMTREPYIGSTVEAIPQAEVANYFGALRIQLALYRELMRRADSFDLALSTVGITNSRIRRLSEEKVMRAALAVDKDPDGCPHNYGVELCRDVASVCFVYAGLFGDSNFLDQGLQLLDSVAAHTKDLRQHVELESLLRRGLHGEHIDAAKLRFVYDGAREAAPPKSERRAVNAVRLISSRSSSLVGLGVYDFVSNITLKDISRDGSIFGREIMKTFAERIFTSKMRKTRPIDFDSSGYRLDGDVHAISAILSS